MAINKIGALGYAQTLPALQMSLAAGEVFLLPAGQGVVGTFNSSSNLSLTGWTLDGQYIVELGKYTIIQYFDPNLQVWRSFGAAGQTATFTSDGTNYRIANLTGCPVGAIITTASSSLINGFYGYNQAGQAVTIQNGVTTLGNTTLTVTPSAGGSTWNAIVGGAINTTVTITSGGASYTKAPLLVFNPPASQGSQPYILPTAICTISGGAINAVTVVNQGAGLVAAPTITVIPQPGDTTGGGGILTVNATLVGSGTLLWLQPATPGTSQTSTPTLTFSPSGAAATVIMDYTVTGLTVTAAGVAYTSGITYSVVVGAAQIAGSAANTNPMFDVQLLQPRPAQLTVTTAGTTFASNTTVVVDAGHGFPAVPPAYYPFYVGASTQAVLTPTVGGQTDTFKLYNL